MRVLWNEMRNISSALKELRQFGFTLGIFLTVLASLWIWRHKSHADIILVLAVFFLSLGMVAPGALKPFQKVWMSLALVMGAIMSRLVLCILFYTVITPIGLFLRLSGKDPLNKKWREKKESFWSDRDTLGSKSAYENQY